MVKTAKNILSRNHEEVIGFFMKSEQHHGFELPEYLTLDEVQRYVCEKVETPFEESVSSKNVGCSHYALHVISSIIDSLRDMDEKRSIIDLVYRKLCNQPSISYNQICFSRHALHSGEEARHITIFSPSLLVSSWQAR